MFCYKCGNKTQEGAAFCDKCGTALHIEKTDDKKPEAVLESLNVGKEKLNTKIKGLAFRGMLEKRVTPEARMRFPVLNKIIPLANYIVCGLVVLLVVVVFANAVGGGSGSGSSAVTSSISIDHVLVGGRWVANNGDSFEFFSNGTGKTNYGYGRTNLGLWNLSIYNPSREGIYWMAENGRLTLTAQAVVVDQYTLGNDTIRLPSYSYSGSFQRRGEGTGLIGVWMPVVGGGNGFQLNADGTGLSQVRGMTGGNFTWTENDGVLTRTFRSSYSFDYTVQGDRLTIFMRNSSTGFTRVGGN